MKIHKFTLLVVMLIMVVSVFAQQSPKREYIYTVGTRGIRGKGTIHHNGDSTALYQRVATGNPSEPYTTGAIVRWLHYPSSLHPNEPSQMIAEEEFGLYKKGKKEVYVTVTIDGVRYFISAYDIRLNMATSESWVHDWVFDTLEPEGEGTPWGKIILFSLGGILLLGIIVGKTSKLPASYSTTVIPRDPPRRTSSSSSSGSSNPEVERVNEYHRRLEEERKEREKEKERKRKEEEKKRREAEEAYRKKIRQQNCGY